MGCIFSSLKQKQQFNSTASILARTGNETPVSVSGKSEVIKSSLSIEMEEKKEVTVQPPPFLNQNMLELIAQVTLTKKLSTPLLQTIACNRELADRLFLLNTVLPLTCDILISIASHEKYAIKIIDTIELLIINHVPLTEKSINAIAEAEFDLQSVSQAILECPHAIYSREDLIIAIAKAGRLAKPVATAFLELSKEHIVLTNTIVNSVIHAIDPLLFAQSILTLASNNIPLSDFIIKGIANAQCYSQNVANALVTLQSAGFGMDSAPVSVALRAKEKAESSALWAKQHSHLLLQNKTNDAKQEEECAVEAEENKSCSQRRNSRSH